MKAAVFWRTPSAVLGTIVAASKVQSLAWPKYDHASDDLKFDTTTLEILTKTPITMPATYSDNREDRKPGWVFTSHPSHQPYIAMNGETLDPNQNLPNRFESFLLGEGEKKVEMKLDTRMPNTSIFHFNKEDHTLGNLLRSKLLTNSHVIFSGYKVPHPLFPNFELRVQTDGEITPKEAVLGSCKDLVRELNQLKSEFTKEYELRKMVSGTQNGH